MAAVVRGTMTTTLGMRVAAMLVSRTTFMMGHRRRRSYSSMLRNVAVIAHVDHGKTTLMDKLMNHNRIETNASTSPERAMDSKSLEKERGITIQAKYTSFAYGGYVINAVDTPGHADFSGEVERALDMVDGVLVLVDASEGPMTQTKFVLRKALQKGLKPVVVLNKVDRDGVNQAGCDAVETNIFDLVASLGANDEQLDFPVCYASARAGVASTSLAEAREHIAGGTGSIEPILKLIVDHIPPPSGRVDAPFRMLVSMIDRDPFLGRIVTGRVMDGSCKVGDRLQALRLGTGGVRESFRVQKIFTSTNLKRNEIERASSGDIVTISGVMDATEPLHSTPIDPPTLRMSFSVNDSSLAGKEGKQLTERQIEERLKAEAETDVALRVEIAPDGKGLDVQGRGELHLGVLIETMRREGFELSVSPPAVIYGVDEATGRKTEPIEEVIVEVDEADVGGIIEAITQRKGEMTDMQPDAGEGGRTRLTFLAPSRGLIGFRQEFTNLTRGTGFLQRAFHSYGPTRGKMDKVRKGMLICTTSGVATTYALGALEPRGVLFIGPQEEVYEGMIIGEHSRDNDLEVNPTKTKKLTNIRASGVDETIRLTPPKRINLEEAIGYVGEDELIEVTPKAIRLRKAELASGMRRRATRRSSTAD
jgi:GTP-binding protein